MMYGQGAGMNGWGYAVMVLAVMVLVGLVAAGVLALARLGNPTRHPGAEQILQERFARGEVDEQEFRSRMDGLRTDSRQ
jgi:putative membrane protein